MRGVLVSLILGVGVAACSSGPAGRASQTTANVSESEVMSASSGFSEPDLKAMRPETEHSREVLLRLKGSTAKHQTRGR